MTLAQLKEIVRTVQVQNTMFMGGAIVVHNLTQEQLLAIILLAQSQLIERECLVPIDSQPSNPS